MAKSCKRRFRQMVSFTLVAVRRERCTCRCIKKPPEKGVHGCVRGCLRSPPLSPRPVNLEELVFCLQLTAVIIYGLGLHSGEDRNRSVESLSRPPIFCWFFFCSYSPSPKPKFLVCVWIERRFRRRCGSFWCSLRLDQEPVRVIIRRKSVFTGF